MRTYYIFVVNDVFKKLYQGNESVLFSIIETMYNSKKTDIGLCADIYKQVVSIFNKRLYDEFILNKFKTDENYCLTDKIHYYNIGQTKNGMIIYNSHIRISTNQSGFVFLKPLSMLSDNMFICDFDNQEYFWLEDVVLKTIKIKA